MAKDSQTIENSASLKDLDVFCQVTEQTALEKIADAWHIIRTAQEHHDNCVGKFSPKQDSCVLASGRKSVNELPSIHLAKYLRQPHSDEAFDVLAQEVYQVIVNLEAHRKKVDSELHSLKTSQDSKLQSAQSELFWAGDKRLKEQEKSEQLNRDILVESGFLLGAFILGWGGGSWGAIIALAVMFWWRASLS
jgi:hypothetical protein